MTRRVKEYKTSRPLNAAINFDSGRRNIELSDVANQCDAHETQGYANHKSGKADQEPPEKYSIEYFLVQVFRERGGRGSDIFRLFYLD